MKRLINGKGLLTCALALLLLLPPVAALASVGASVKADASSVQQGAAVEVTVTVSGKGMAIAEGSFTYDTKVLTYAGSEGGASDGLLNLVSAQKGGADTLTARIRFTAASAGSAKIEVSIEKVLGYDGKEQGTTQADVSLTVTAPAPTPAPTPISYAANGVLAKNVQGASGNLYIWRSLENVTVPSRYSETTLSYHGETVAAATVEDNSAPTLLYLSNDAGDQGGYYIYDAAADTLYPYQTISSVSKTYIILDPDGSAALPQGFTETTLTIGKQQYKAWKSQSEKSLYLLYARNPDGDAGYYVYNTEDGSLQRYAVLPAQPGLPSAQATAPGRAAPATDSANKVVISKPGFYAICGGGALLLIATVWLVLSRIPKAERKETKESPRRAMTRRMAQRKRTHTHGQGLGQ